MTLRVWRVKICKQILNSSQYVYLSLKESGFEILKLFIPEQTSKYTEDKGKARFLPDREGSQNYENKKTGMSCILWKSLETMLFPGFWAHLSISILFIIKRKPNS